MTVTNIDNPPRLNTTIRNQTSDTKCSRRVNGREQWSLSSPVTVLAEGDAVMDGG